MIPSSKFTLIIKDDSDGDDDDVPFLKVILFQQLNHYILMRFN